MVSWNGLVLSAVFMVIVDSKQLLDVTTWQVWFVTYWTEIITTIYWMIMIKAYFLHLYKHDLLVCDQIHVAITIQCNNETLINMSHAWQNGLVYSCYILGMCTGSRYIDHTGSLPSIWWPNQCLPVSVRFISTLRTYFYWSETLKFTYFGHERSMKVKNPQRRAILDDVKCGPQNVFADSRVTCSKMRFVWTRFKG